MLRMSINDQLLNEVELVELRCESNSLTRWRIALMLLRKFTFHRLLNLQARSYSHAARSHKGAVLYLNFNLRRKFSALISPF